MSDQFLNSHKLATLAELRYLLLEVLERNEPISWYDLSFSCKEQSLNMAFAFENSIAFLQRISLVHIHIDRSVSRTEADYKSMASEQDFGNFILKRTIAYLEKNSQLEEVFNKKTVQAEQDLILIKSHEFPVDFLFVQVLLLNLGVIISDKDRNDVLRVAQAYKAYFREELLPKVFKDMTWSKKEIADSDPGKNNQAINSGELTKIPTFFISYAYKDKDFKNELQNHLSGLKRSKLIKDWEGRAILPGQEWEDEIREKLEQAEVVLFLVSSDFLASDYIHDVEIKKTIERHIDGKVRIIPIILRPCDFDSLPIKRYQALPDGAKAISLWENRDEAYLNIVNRIKEVIKQMSNRTSYSS